MFVLSISMVFHYHIEWHFSPSILFTCRRDSLEEYGMCIAYKPFIMSQLHLCQPCSEVWRQSTVEPVSNGHHFQRKNINFKTYLTLIQVLFNTGAPVRVHQCWITPVLQSIFWDSLRVPLLLMVACYRFHCTLLCFPLGQWIAPSAASRAVNGPVINLKN